MSAEVTPDDAAKARAEERAERELQLKIDTLKLELEKFRYTRDQAADDRMGAALLRGTAALLFAHGSTLAICLTSFKTLSDTVPKPILRQGIGLLSIGFICGSMAFVAALLLSAVPARGDRKRLRRGMVAVAACGFFAVVSFSLFEVVLVGSLKTLKDLDQAQLGTVNR